MSSSASLFPNQYDRAFKDAALFLPIGTDWRLLKAQCWQESRLIPQAVSPAGAFGVCQFMLATASEMLAKHDELTNLWIPEQSILAAALYMRQLIRGWSAPRPPMDRYMLALASYNAGFGNLLAAQRLADDANRYVDIIDELEDVTGTHSEETITYVKLIISKWYPAMLFD